MKFKKKFYFFTSMFKECTFSQVCSKNTIFKEYYFQRIYFTNLSKINLTFLFLEHPSKL